MRSLRRARALARVELRGLRRARARSLLIAALITLPVAALVGASTLLRILLPTPEEKVAHALGTADLRIEGGEKVVRQALALLPGAAEVEPLAASPEHVVVPGLRLAATRCAFSRGGLASGMFRLVAGRWPATGREVALSPLLRQLARAQDGDEVVLESDGRRATVVGSVVDPENLDLPLVVGLPGDPVPGARTVHLVRLPADSRIAEVSTALEASGAGVQSVAGVRARPRFPGSAAFALGALGFLEAALVVAAAFTIGVRRRQREIGLLAATGAAPGDILRSVLTTAVLLAAVGGICGAFLGIAAAAALHPHLDAWNGRWNGAFEVPGLQVLAAVGLGVGTAVAAAAWPAREAARLPVRLALAGRRPARGAAGSWLRGSFAFLGTGVIATLAAPAVEGPPGILLGIAGPALGVLGFGAASPWLLHRFAQRAAALPLPWRLAVRNAGRSRSRDGAVVTAVLAGMATSVTVAAILTSMAEEGEWEVLRADQVSVDGPAASEVARRIARELGAVGLAALNAVTLEGTPVDARVTGTTARGWVAVGGADLLATLGAGTRAPDALVALGAECAGRPVELLPAFGHRILATLPAQDLVLEERVREPAFVMAETQVLRLRLDAGPPPGHLQPPWLVRLSAPVRGADLEKARRIATEFPGTSVDARLLQARQPRLLYRVVLGLAGLTGLLILTVATALAAQESEAESAVLRAVGAPPSLGEAVGAAQAGFLAFLGCVLAVPAGLLPAFGAVRSLGLKPVMPWTEILATTLVLPVIAYGGGWLWYRVRQRVAGSPSPGVHR